MPTDDAPPTRVVIAGGGIAALEALLALRDLAGTRVELTLLAPGEDFVHRPLAVTEPFGLGRPQRVPLAGIGSRSGRAWSPRRWSGWTRRRAWPSPPAATGCPSTPCSWPPARGPSRRSRPP